MEVGREVGGEKLRVLIDGIEIKKVERYKYLGVYSEEMEGIGKKSQIG